MDVTRALSGARLRPLRFLKETSFEKMSAKTSTEIIDIRPGPTEFDILQDIKDGLRPEHGGEKTLPTMLLYDEAGLRLFEKITYVKDYYLTDSEIEVLDTYADQIAERIKAGSVLVELGSGNLRKVNILLQAIERLGKDVEYYAVDLSLPELERTFAEIPTNYQHVKLKGLYGTYDHALEWLKSPKVSAKPKTILWLGSSLGNFTRADVPPFLTGFREALQPGDTMLIGIDSCKEPERVFRAYNDTDGVTRDFTLNGLKNANRIMGTEAFKPHEWEHCGEFVEKDGYHRAFVSPLKDVIIDGVHIKKGERIRIEESWKFSKEEIEHLWSEAGLIPNTTFSTARGDYGLHFVSKPAFFFPTKPERYAAKPVPSIAEWRELWTAWDDIAQKMVPTEALLSKPIKLRNAVIFYLGHIPTFLDIHLTRATDEKPTEPAAYTKIFERGIDPDVDNPEQCHDHSEIPETWPPRDEVLAFQDAVRKRTKALYDSNAAHENPRVSRALWLAFEHEAMHLETLLYMLIQSERILPPPGSVMPSFDALARKSKKARVENQWFTIPEAEIRDGLDDPEDGSAAKRYFGWDNEKPTRSLRVKSFKAKARPITNGEYADYLVQTGKCAVPASWCDGLDPAAKVVVNGANRRNGTNSINSSIDKVMQGKYVRTVFGTVPLHYALDWPVVASYDELASCAQWMGGRIPTLEEARSIYNYVEHGKAQEFEKTHGNKIPAVNGHLINNGVSESPPSQHLSNGSSGTGSDPKPGDLFIDLEGTNTAFQHWHPISVAEKGDKLCGQADLGGAWEWTSTVLEKHDGFSAMPLYPGYTADFFDGKHNIMLGGSWATHSRIAGRKTFVNWYQRNYPYVWATARLVQDV